MEVKSINSDTTIVADMSNTHASLFDVNKWNDEPLRNILLIPKLSLIHFVDDAFIARQLSIDADN